ncbi:serine/threonine protein kinase [Paenibacillus sp. NPDC058071]|uniref:serine/threonine protein kinase n=1 Tax=Paenibacillus sp. NPDC058071 TaxID=3346326 RepID=UPI0036DCF2E8
MLKAETIHHATANTDELCRNTRIGAKYQIKRMIHQSELSIVYKARETDTGETKLIKEFFPRSLAKRGQDRSSVIVRKLQGEAFAELKLLFECEAAALKELNHPGIIAYSDYIEMNGTAYIVMEYCKGITLEQYIKQSEDNVSPVKIAAILRTVVDALAHVHERGFLHRDIKPANIMVEPATGATKLIDFGSAIPSGSLDKQAILTSTGYSPLEFYSETSRQGVASDIYSLAATVYFAYAGQAPVDVKRRLFEDELTMLRSRNRQAGFFLSRIVHWGLRMSPKQRCGSLRWFEAGLRWEGLTGGWRKG